MSAGKKKQSEPLVLRFQLTLSDYEEAVLHALGRTEIFTMRPTRKRLVILWLGLVVLFVTVNLVFPVENMSSFLVALTLMVTAGILAFWLMPFTTARTGYRKQGFAGRVYEYRFDDEGVKTLETGMKTQVSWSRIDKAAIANGVLMLSMSAMQVLIVPLRACANRQQHTALFDLVKAHVETTIPPGSWVVENTEYSDNSLHIRTSK